jgi:hypothetical protein
MDIEIQLANAARNWLDACSDVESYHPTDGSQSGRDNAGALIQNRNDCEKEFRVLVEKIKQEAVAEAIERVTGHVSNGMQTGKSPYWANYNVQRFIQELKTTVNNSEEC